MGAHGQSTGFKLRMANGGQNELLAVEIRVLLCMTETVDRIRTRKFHQLVLDRHKTTFLPLDWMVVHTISGDSPLHGLTENDLRERDAEFLILVMRSTTHRHNRCMRGRRTSGRRWFGMRSSVICTALPGTGA